GLTYDFTLRQDVAFHHTSYFTPTRPFNAEDVVFTFNRIMEPTHPYHFLGGGISYFQKSMDILLSDVSYQHAALWDALRHLTLPTLAWYLPDYRDYPLYAMPCWMCGNKIILKPPKPKG
ncbi:ABC transporter substrate-binding protein, partial [Alishewanella longhuensis]